MTGRRSGDHGSVSLELAVLAAPLLAALLALSFADSYTRGRLQIDLAAQDAARAASQARTADQARRAATATATDALT